MKETKTRKKSVILAAIVLLLIAVIALGATTYAKYITSANTTAQATVAKWGFTVTANANDFFSDAYNKGEHVDATAEGTAVDVKASGLTVAPGTSGSMTVTLNGSAEVKAQLKVTVKAEDVSLTYQDEEGQTQTYNPIVWTVKKGETEVLSNTTLDAALKALEGIQTTYEVGDQVDNEEYTISWAWAFDGQNDEYDTILGQFADKQVADGQEVDGYTAVYKLSFNLTVSIEQIQNK